MTPKIRRILLLTMISATGFAYVAFMLEYAAKKKSQMTMVNGWALLVMFLAHVILFVFMYRLNEKSERVQSDQLKKAFSDGYYMDLKEAGLYCIVDRDEEFIYAAKTSYDAGQMHINHLAEEAEENDQDYSRLGMPQMPPKKFPIGKFDDTLPYEIEFDNNVVVSLLPGQWFTLCAFCAIKQPLSIHPLDGDKPFGGIELPDPTKTP